MSMLGGLGGGDSESFKPSKAPKPPKRNDPDVNRRAMNAYRRQAKRNSYAKSLLGGSAAQPTKSYSAQIFGTGT